VAEVDEALANVEQAAPSPSEIAENRNQVRPVPSSVVHPKILWKCRENFGGGCLWRSVSYVYHYIGVPVWLARVGNPRAGYLAEHRPESRYIMFKRPQKRPRRPLLEDLEIRTLLSVDLSAVGPSRPDLFDVSTVFSEVEAVAMTTGNGVLELSSATIIAIEPGIAWNVVEFNDGSSPSTSLPSVGEWASGSGQVAGGASVIQFGATSPVAFLIEPVAIVAGQGQNLAAANQAVGPWNEQGEPAWDYTPASIAVTSGSIITLVNPDAVVEEPGAGGPYVVSLAPALEDAVENLGGGGVLNAGRDVIGGGTTAVGEMPSLTDAVAVGAMTSAAYQNGGGGVTEPGLPPELSMAATDPYNGEPGSLDDAIATIAGLHGGLSAFLGNLGRTSSAPTASTFSPLPLLGPSVESSSGSFASGTATDDASSTMAQSKGLIDSVAIGTREIDPGRSSLLGSSTIGSGPDANLVRDAGTSTSREMLVGGQGARVIGNGDDLLGSTGRISGSAVDQVLDSRNRGSGSSEKAVDADGLPTPSGADLVGELLPFSAQSIREAVDQFVNGIQELEVPDVVALAMPRSVVVLTSVAIGTMAAAEMARRKLRGRGPAGARVGGLSTSSGSETMGFPELPGSWSTRYT
jgi:hypothetical protein